MCIRDRRFTVNLKRKAAIQKNCSPNVCLTISNDNEATLCIKHKSEGITVLKNNK